MPELPEVASFENYLNKYATGNKIIEAITFDSYLLKSISKKKLESALTNNTITSTYRHGKNLFCNLKKEGILYFHFGMTGYFKVADSADDLQYAQLILRLENQKYFAFICKRKLGKIMLLNDIEDYLKENKIGSDALSISKKVFLETVSSRRGSIKSLLMNQSFIAGIGNEFSDEILFQSKIHPESTPKNLPDKKINEIFDKMQKILNTALAAGADRKKLQQYFFLENRKSGEDCPGGKGKTVKKSIGGRSAYFCPEIQQLY